jgi:HK97 family phage major capsid protein
MANVNQLRSELVLLNDQIDRLHKDERGNLREFTPAEQKRFDGLLAERTKLDEELQKHEEILHAASNPSQVVEPGSDSARDRWGANVKHRSAGKAWQVRDGAAGDEVRGRAVDALEHLGASDDSIERALGAMLDQARHPEEQNELARRIAVCSSPDYARAFAKLACDPVSGHNSWTGPERAAWDQMLEVRAALKSGATTGSYMVPTHLDPTIILTNSGTSNVIRQMSRVVQLPVGNTWHGVSSDGVTASFDAELAEVSDDSPTLANPSIPVQKAQALVQFSIEAAEDIANLQSEVLMLFNDAKDRLEETKFAVGAGSGSNEPKGVFTTISATTASRVVSTTAAAIGTPDLKAVYRAVPARYRRVSKWLTNPLYSLAVKDLGTAVSASYSGDLREPAASRWYDLPVVESDDSPTTQTTTALDPEILLGDWSKFVVVDRLGAQAELIPFLFNTANNLPDGRRAVYFHWRTGSDVVDTNAFRLLCDKTTA